MSLVRGLEIKIKDRLKSPNLSSSYHLSPKALGFLVPRGELIFSPCQRCLLSVDVVGIIQEKCSPFSI